jgi:uncharacterized membrane protein
MKREVTDPNEQKRIVDEFIVVQQREEKKQRHNNRVWNYILGVGWTTLILSAEYYFWWCVNGDWRNHTENSLLAHDLVIYGPVPVALGAVWLILFVVLVILTLKRILGYNSPKF